MKRILLFAVAVASLCAAQTAFADPTTIVQDASGGQKARSRILVFPTGSVTNNAGTHTVTFSTGVASGSTNYIQNRSTEQSGATMYVSSGTIIDFNAGVIKVSTTIASGNLLRLFNTSGTGNPFTVNSNHAVTAPTYYIYNTAADFGITGNAVRFRNQNESGGHIIMQTLDGYGGEVQVPNGNTRLTYGLIVGTVTFSNTATGGIVGTTTNDSAAAGYYGQYASTESATYKNFPTSGQYGDLLSFSLTAGDWDVSSSAVADANGATVVYWQQCIGTATGNDSSGCDTGSNFFTILPPTATSGSAFSIPSWRVSLSGTTTIYLKMLANYSVATPIAQGRMSARRVR